MYSNTGEVTITFDYDLRPDIEREGIDPLLDVYVDDAAGERTTFGKQLTGVDGPATFDQSVTLKPGTYTRHIMSTYLRYCDCLPIKDIVEPYTFTVPEKVDPTPSPTPTPTATATPSPEPTGTPSPEPTTEPTATPTPQSTETPSPSPIATSKPIAISLSSTTVARGNPITVNASGLAAGEQVEIWLHSTPVKLLSTTASADGTISKTVTIQSDVAIGAHEIEVRGATSGSAYAALTVSDGLAVTGFDARATATTGIGASTLIWLASPSC
ncbi:hypothetical protein RWH44_12290 [Microbacterium sp. KSW2-29]|uniref:Bacterial Ig-like domain-containing protein n=1 Tax=Microbacterium phycohabitans TaxID=3075993 RepID=A0ABU3SPA0_9MICO|nr:hypothetical protein [Microbacterium sp. KSW2-29]MDU0346476.1 hypothetical protein [Microbacterium sp. KSW2-29]